MSSDRRASREKFGGGDSLLKHDTKYSLRSVALSSSETADLVPFTKTFELDKDVRGLICLTPDQNFLVFDVEFASCWKNCCFAKRILETMRLRSNLYFFSQSVLLETLYLL